MYYRSPGNLNPILPRSDLTPAVVANNFDERTVVNDDLNVNGYFIYNLKNPEDDCSMLVTTPHLLIFFLIQT